MAWLVAAVLAGLCWTARAGEPARPAALSADEVKAEQAKETPEQKALRAELSEPAKKGEKVYWHPNWWGPQAK
jgi:DsbC/DsbD-like thiol-disulfide interchange protein